MLNRCDVNGNRTFVTKTEQPTRAPIGARDSTLFDLGGLPLECLRTG